MEDRASGNTEYQADASAHQLPVVPPPPSIAAGESVRRNESGGWSPTAWRAGSGTDPSLVWQLGGTIPSGEK